jgi:hypothetical protein
MLEYQINLGRGWGLSQPLKHPQQPRDWEQGPWRHTMLAVGSCVFPH